MLLATKIDPAIIGGLVVLLLSFLVAGLNVRYRDTQHVVEVAHWQPNAPRHPAAESAKSPPASCEIGSSRAGWGPALASTRTRSPPPRARSISVSSEGRATPASSSCEFWRSTRKRACG